MEFSSLKGGIREMIRVNEYCEGKIKSLGFQLEGIDYTVGLMLPGNYTFNMEIEGHITGVWGEFEIKHEGGDWGVVRPGDTIVITRNSTVNYRIKKPASYVCKFPKGFKRCEEI
jgi:uncharacterized protein YaiE (UPF0345 family)